MLLALVAVRALLVLACSDVFYYGEEIGKGAGAKAMLDGLPVPHYRLNYAVHEGGGFVVMHLKALAFWLVGESMLAIKLVALSTTALVLWVGVKLADECFGARTALIFGVLFVLCPDSYLRCSLLSLGTHFEALIFITLVLLFALRIARTDGGALLDWAKLGLSAGFGLYFSLQTLPAIAVAGLCLLFTLRGQIFGRGLALASVTALLGAAPLWMMLRLIGMEAVRARSLSFGGPAGASVSQSVQDLFTPLFKQGNVLDWIALALYALCLCALPFVLREKRERQAALWIAAYLVCFVGLYVFSGLSVDMGIWFLYLRTSSLWFFATLLLATAVAHLRGPLRFAGWSALALVLYGNVLDARHLLRAGAPRQMLANFTTLHATKGFDYVEYFNQFIKHVDFDERRKIEVLLHFDDESELLPASIAHSVFDKSPMPLPAILKLVRQTFGARQEQALLGLGRKFHPGEEYNLPYALGQLADYSPAERALFGEAIGRTGVGPRYRIDRLDEQIALAPAGDLREPFLRGTGFRIYMAFRLNPRLGRTYVEVQRAELRPALRAGFDAAHAANTLPGRR